MHCNANQSTKYYQGADTTHGVFWLNCRCLKRRERGEGRVVQLEGCAKFCSLPWLSVVINNQFAPMLLQYTLTRHHSVLLIVCASEQQQYRYDRMGSAVRSQKKKLGKKGQFDKKSKIAANEETYSVGEADSSAHVILVHFAHDSRDLKRVAAVPNVVDDARETRCVVGEGEFANFAIRTLEVEMMSQTLRCEGAVLEAHKVFVGRRQGARAKEFVHTRSWL